MKKWPMCRSGTCLALMCLLLLTLLPGLLSAQGIAYAHVKRTGLVSIYPLMQYATKAQIGVLPSCLQSTTGPRCYSPQQLQQAYNMQALSQASSRGRGQTIVIVDAYQSPTIRADLHLFDMIFGLPDPWLDIIAPFGLRPYNINNPSASNFALEIALDVEWAHAMAPAARIALVLGNPADDTNRSQIAALIAATRYAVTRNLGSVISLSVGAAEACYQPGEIPNWHSVFRQARNQRISVFVSSGDTGSDVGTCDANGNFLGDAQGVEYPASDPLVTSIGGTTLQTSSSGVHQSETAWNGSAINAGATGGGYSGLFARPAYQNGIAESRTTRGIPDVSYLADPLTSVLVVSSSYLPGPTMIIPVGGTSIGAPQWAAMIALANQAAKTRLGFLNDALYRIGRSRQYNQAFYDITGGDNTFIIPTLNGANVIIPGFSTGHGWDAVTGLGSPKISVLARLLAQNVRSDDGTEL